MRKYLTISGTCQRKAERRGKDQARTIIDLLEGHLGVLWQALLGLAAQHKGLWLLGRGHGMLLGVHWPGAERAVSEIVSG